MSETAQPEKNTSESGANAKPATNRRAARGRAALLANLSDDDDNSSDSCSNGPVTKRATGGIYLQKLHQTKQEIKENHHKFDTVVETEILKKSTKINKKEENESDDVFESSKDSEANLKQTETSNEDDEICIPDSPDSPPSPPIPSSYATTRNRCKSDQQVERQLKELEMLACKKPKNKNKNDESFNSFIIADDDEIFNLITVKVLTKDGICSFEMNKNQSFVKIYEDLAAKHGTQTDGIVLTLKDRVINYSDTPASIELKIYDIVECGKLSSKTKQERIKIINDEEDESGENVPPNLIRVIFQTEEGRKSRIKFLILKTETFENVLKKYKEKRSMPDGNYVIEFDGEHVDLKSTPTDLDLDGDEIMDVKKGYKSVMQKVAENQKVYDYDDDILPC